jgi:hypothetical protein
MDLDDLAPPPSHKVKYLLQKKFQKNEFPKKKTPFMNRVSFRPVDTNFFKTN